MGRSATWLNHDRPAIIAILNQIEKNALEKIGTQSGRYLTPFFEALRFKVSRRRDGEARSERAMRQAWFRWKTNSPQAAIPPITDLALITEFAEQHGLLKGLEQKSHLEIIEKLKTILEEKRMSVRAATESTWNAKARLTAEDLFDFLEVRISNHYLGKDHDVSPISKPDSIFVQHEAGEMIKKLITKLLSKLKENRTILDSTQEQESIYIPLDGWPNWMNQLASEVSSLITAQAKEYSLLDQAYLDRPFKGGHAQGRFIHRVKILPEYNDDQSDQLEDPPNKLGDDDGWVPLR